MRALASVSIWHRMVFRSVGIVHRIIMFALTCSSTPADYFIARVNILSSIDRALKFKCYIQVIQAQPIWLAIMNETRRKKRKKKSNVK